MVGRFAPALALLVACTIEPVEPDGHNITEDEQPGADWACTATADCTADYRAFLDVAADHARPISEDALAAQLAALADHQVPLATDTSGLSDVILDGLNLRFLRDGLADRPLRVSVTARSETDTYEERDLLFVDPYVGTFKAILLVPRTPGPVPGIVALHGHPDDAAIYRDKFHGNEYPAHGYAILMLTLRAMAIDESEHAISHDLLLRGFTLMGLRAYEAMLGLEYLRTRPEVISDKVGVIGHSGGSSATDLLAWVEPGAAAFVSDHTVDWASSGADEPYHCETVPALYPHHVHINDLTSAPRPVKQVFYGYIFGMDEIFAFFDGVLKR